MQKMEIYNITVDARRSMESPHVTGSTKRHINKGIDGFHCASACLTSHAHCVCVNQLRLLMTVTSLSHVIRLLMTSLSGCKCWRENVALRITGIKCARASFEYMQRTRVTKARQLLRSDLRASPLFVLSVNGTVLSTAKRYSEMSFCSCSTTKTYNGKCSYSTCIWKAGEICLV